MADFNFFFFFKYDRTERRREEDFSVSPQNVLGNTIDPIPSSSRTIPPTSTTTINTATTTTAAATVSSRKSLFSSTETSQIEISLGAAGPPQHAALLKDLFWTLYSKLAAVLEGHRVMYEVSRWVSSVGTLFLHTQRKVTETNVFVFSDRASRIARPPRVHLSIFQYWKCGGLYSKK